MNVFVWCAFDNLSQPRNRICRHYIMKNHHTETNAVAMYSLIVNFFWLHLPSSPLSCNLFMSLCIPHRSLPVYDLLVESGDYSILGIF
jgi:hypothetical protein